ncbi:IclR family transcriptional regulator C-terminal domain-containing protein [Prauserella oleivorans]|uniref:IclR family transcriptional regulator C-terminal domain-containing protein n=1 Tax=Prauserella oleivorans TaxID=1478153 RepID=A0ABW5W8U9_9PSEU
MDTERNPRDHIQSLERGFAVLQAFDEQRTNPTLAELAAATGLARPVVRRILITLENLGYVRGEAGRWSLTPRVLSIGHHYSASHAVVEVSQPHLLRLAEQTNESASLAALDGSEVVYIGRVPVRRIMSINVAIGTRIPAHATSLGRVLLAWAPAERVQQVIDETGLRAFTERTITDPAEFRRNLATVRRQGYSLVAGELEEGLVSLSAPVRDPAGNVVAALATSTSTARADLDRLRGEIAPLVIRTAEAISSDYGYKATSGKATSTVHTAHEGFF